MSPLIGITVGSNSDGDYFLRRQYCAAVLRAGGIPILLPPVGKPSAAIGICDGFLFSGGGDITPRLCGIKEYNPAFLFDVSPVRDEYELELITLAYNRDIPILGICRGIQVLNTALGGTLFFDIKAHEQKIPREQPSHSINIKKGSVLHRLIGADTLEVNSFHHQAICKSAEALQIAAMSEDGIIEAMEDESKRFCLGVQWHPEHMESRDADVLFAALTAAASSRKR